MSLIHSTDRTDIIARMWARMGFVISFLTWAQPIGLSQIIPGEAPVEVRIPFPPVPAKVNSQTVLAYELHVTNLLSREINLNRIEVFGEGAAREQLVSYQENDLVKAIRQYGAPSQPADTRRIPGGFRAVVYM